MFILGLFDLKTTCPSEKEEQERIDRLSTPATPEFYKEQIRKDIQCTFEHALDMLKKCEPGTGEAEFYMDIIKANEQFHIGM